MSLRMPLYQRGFFQNILIMTKKAFKGSEKTQSNMSSVIAGEFRFANTELCVDLKLLTYQPGSMKTGKHMQGAIRRDSYDHFTFVEKATMPNVPPKRNPIVYSGMYVNVHKNDEGMLYPTFNRPVYSKNFSFTKFCHKAARELRYVAPLIEEMNR